MTATEVIAVLRKHHQPTHREHQWAFFDEQKIGTGFGFEAQQSMDAWAIHYWPSRGNIAVAYEVKVSRSDFLRELKKPLKRKPALRLSHEFYFATPEGLVKPGEIPPECGLIEIKNNKMYTTVKAPKRDICPPTWNFVATLCRHIWRMEMDKDPTVDSQGTILLKGLADSVEKFLGNPELKWFKAKMETDLKQYRMHIKMGGT